MTGEQSDRPMPVTGRAVILKSPAVRSMYGKRVYFTDDFKVHLLATLRKGNSPTDLFRSVGLPPEIIGRKRIERCASHARQDGRVRALLEDAGDTWSQDAPENTGPDTVNDRVQRAPKRADDPWGVIMSMSYRINYLDKRVRELERLVDGTVPPVAVGAAHGGGGE